MTDFENQVLSALGELNSKMETNFDKVNKRLDKIESDIEVMKEDIEITRVASNANGQKLEELEKLLKELDVIA